MGKPTTLGQTASAKLKTKPKAKPKALGKTKNVAVPVAGGKRHNVVRKFRPLITTSTARKLLLRAGIPTFARSCIGPLAADTQQQLVDVLKYAALDCHAKGRMGINAAIMARALGRMGVFIL